ncbi:LuxR C-terminal-related transcriptional regulator [Micromonospora cathayae]|uniref:LuxR C-terminal-related transcriptional regulator n=1 Tax=Micromonospora cathayae TaxID=3028804 RepID=A0ABY7ZYX3_9ACTN|nr:LuxR C-terminal-related transcriptional regulator [Micromonospora sp. HUAS 3]WDZ87218.1 LuxR C-terminal-related transcriptional regulator [Micromonospora sp. HUAS 3]
MTTATVPTTELSPADVLLLRHLAGGLTQRQIAHRLDVTAQTICVRLTRIREQLGAATVVHAVVLAHQAGLIDLDGRR